MYHLTHSINKASFEGFIKILLKADICFLSPPSLYLIRLSPCSLFQCGCVCTHRHSTLAWSSPLKCYFQSFLQCNGNSIFYKFETKKAGFRIPPWMKDFLCSQYMMSFHTNFLPRCDYKCVWQILTFKYYFLCVPFPLFDSLNSILAGFLPQQLLR